MNYRKRLRFAGIVLFFSGIACTVPAAIFYVRTHQFVSRAVRTTGTVLRHIEVKTDKGDTFKPMFQFTDSQGISHQVVSGVGSSDPTEISDGSTVSLLYDPADPNDARIDKFIYIWILPVALGALAVIYIPVGFLMWKWEWIRSNKAGRGDGG